MSNHKIMVMNGKEVYCASLFLNAKTGCAHLLGIRKTVFEK